MLASKVIAPASKISYHKVRKLILGTAQFGMNYGVANRGGQVSVEEVLRIIEVAQRAGIRTLDTAQSYGTSEEIIGSCLGKLRHREFDVITKVSDNSMSIDQRVRECFEKTTVSPKVVLAHSAALFSDSSFQTAVGQFRSQARNIKIGVSLYGEKEIKQVMRARFPPEIVQLPLNILDSSLYQSGVIDEIKMRNIEVHARSVFLQGLFYLSLREVSDQLPAAIPYLKYLAKASKKSMLTIAELSLLWVTSLESVDRVLVGVDNCTQLLSHLKTLEKDVDPESYARALSLECENERVLNPSLWK